MAAPWGAGGFGQWGSQPGGLGGLGGAPQRNTPYPMRQNTPQSGTVIDPLVRDGMGSFQGWQNDWQGRWNAEEGRRRAPGYVQGLRPEMVETLPGAEGYQAEFSQYDPNRPYSGGSHKTLQNVMGTLWDDGYTPDFTALDAERARYEPLFQNRERAQQSFNMMEGQGQRFGMMGPDYTNPGFGQVSGEVNPFSPDMGAGRAAVQGANDGISTDWLTGVYDPTQMQAMGVYRPGGLGGLGGMR